MVDLSLFLVTVWDYNAGITGGEMICAQEIERIRVCGGALVE